MVEPLKLYIASVMLAFLIVFIYKTLKNDEL